MQLNDAGTDIHSFIANTFADLEIENGYPVNISINIELIQKKWTMHKELVFSWVAIGDRLSPPAGIDLCWKMAS